MGVGYILVNLDKREQIGFHQINTGTKLQELVGTDIASTIVTYYLLTNTGDRIGFINDTYDSFMVCGQKYEAQYFYDFEDVTHEVVEELIQKGMVKDNGIIWIYEEENIFVRDLVNAWRL